MKRRYCIRVIGIVACVVAISVAPFAIVNAEDILPPTPFYPTQGQQGAPVAPSFEWSEVVNAVSYDFQLGTDPSLSYTIVDTNLESTQYEYTGNGLDWDTNYYWRVRSIAADETISY
ncbi:MAG: hypothetical protein GX602_03610 [Dehalococcoidales bacterium]|nr:hypothetical protein [Dehalococcoidales bacterium]